MIIIMLSNAKFVWTFFFFVKKKKKGLSYVYWTLLYESVETITFTFWISIKRNYTKFNATEVPFRIIWAASWQNQQNGMCAQRRLRSAWTSAQSDQSLHCPHKESLGSLATQWVHSEDSDQTGRMPRLIWVFAGRTVILLVLSWGGSYFISVAQPQKFGNKTFD